jgi:hypothetical protein
MRMKWDRALKKPLAAGAICFVLAAQYVLAQNLGQNPSLCHSERSEESRPEAKELLRSLVVRQTRDSSE